MIDDSGWKQVSNDVFRKPRYSMLLCVLVGTGIQVCYILLNNYLFLFLKYFLNSSF